MWLLCSPVADGAGASTRSEKRRPKVQWMVARHSVRARFFPVFEAHCSRKAHCRAIRSPHVSQVEGTTRAEAKDLNPRVARRVQGSPGSPMPEGKGTGIWNSSQRGAIAWAVLARIIVG